LRTTINRLDSVGGVNLSDLKLRKESSVRVNKDQLNKILSSAKCLESKFHMLYYPDIMQTMKNHLQNFSSRSQMI
jgi:hypothetical protein